MPIPEKVESLKVRLSEKTFHVLTVLDEELKANGISLEDDRVKGILSLGEDQATGKASVRGLTSRLRRVYENASGNHAGGTYAEFHSMEVRCDIPARKFLHFYRDVMNEVLRDSGVSTKKIHTGTESKIDDHNVLIYWMCRRLMMRALAVDSDAEAKKYLNVIREMTRRLSEEHYFDDSYFLFWGERLSGLGDFLAKHHPQLLQIADLISDKVETLNKFSNTIVKSVEHGEMLNNALIAKLLCFINPSSTSTDMKSDQINTTLDLALRALIKDIAEPLEGRSSQALAVSRQYESTPPQQQVLAWVDKNAWQVMPYIRTKLIEKYGRDKAEHIQEILISIAAVQEFLRTAGGMDMNSAVTGQMAYLFGLYDFVHFEDEIVRVTGATERVIEKAMPKAIAESTAGVAYHRLHLQDISPLQVGATGLQSGISVLQNPMTRQFLLRYLLGTMQTLLEDKSGSVNRREMLAFVNGVTELSQRALEASPYYHGHAHNLIKLPDRRTLALEYGESSRPTPEMLLAESDAFAKILPELAKLLYGKVLEHQKLFDASQYTDNLKLISKTVEAEFTETLAAELFLVAKALMAKKVAAASIAFHFMPDIFSKEKEAKQAVFNLFKELLVAAGEDEESLDCGDGHFKLSSKARLEDLQQIILRLNERRVDDPVVAENYAALPFSLGKLCERFPNLHVNCKAVCQRGEVDIKFARKRSREYYQTEFPEHDSNQHTKDLAIEAEKHFWGDGLAKFAQKTMPVMQHQAEAFLKRRLLAVMVDDAVVAAMLYKGHQTTLKSDLNKLERTLAKLEEEERETRLRGDGGAADRLLPRIKKLRAGVTLKQGNVSERKLQDFKYELQGCSAKQLLIFLRQYIELKQQEAQSREMSDPLTDLQNPALTFLIDELYKKGIIVRRNALTDNPVSQFAMKSELVESYRKFIEPLAFQYCEELTDVYESPEAHVEELDARPQSYRFEVLAEVVCSWVQSLGPQQLRREDYDAHFSAYSDILPPDQLTLRGFATWLKANEQNPQLYATVARALKKSAAMTVFTSPDYEDRFHDDYIVGLHGAYKKFKLGKGFSDMRFNVHPFAVREFDRIHRCKPENRDFGELEIIALQLDSLMERVTDDLSFRLTTEALRDVRERLEFSRVYNQLPDRTKVFIWTEFFDPLIDLSGNKLIENLTQAKQGLFEYHALCSWWDTQGKGFYKESATAPGAVDGSARHWGDELEVGAAIEGLPIALCVTHDRKPRFLGDQFGIIEIEDDFGRTSHPTLPKDVVEYLVTEGILTPRVTAKNTLNPYPHGLWLTCSVQEAKRKVISPQKPLPTGRSSANIINLLGKLPTFKYYRCNYDGVRYHFAGQSVDSSPTEVTLSRLNGRVYDKLCAYQAQPKFANKRRLSPESYRHFISQHSSIGNLIAYTLGGKGAWRSRNGVRSLKCFMADALAQDVRPSAINRKWTSKEFKEVVKDFVLVELGLSGEKLDLDNYRDLREYIAKVCDRACELASSSQTFRHSEATEKAAKMLDGLLTFSVNGESLKGCIYRGTNELEILDELVKGYSHQLSEKREHRTLDERCPLFSSMFKSRGSCWKKNIPRSAERLNPTEFRDRCKERSPSLR